MRKVRLKDGCDVWVSWLSAREGVEVRHTCLEGHGNWKAGDYVSPIVEVYPAEGFGEVYGLDAVAPFPDPISRILDTHISAGRSPFSLKLDSVQTVAKKERTAP